MRYAPIEIVVNGDMAAGIVSETVPLDQVFGFAIQAVYTTAGTLTGTLSLEASCDHEEDNERNVIVPGTWTEIANSPVVLAGAGNYVWNVASPNYLWVRLVWVPGAMDSGNLNVTCVTKGF